MKSLMLYLKIKMELSNSPEFPIKFGRNSNFDNYLKGWFNYDYF